MDDCYSPAGLYNVFAAGFLPVPDLWGCREEFRHAVDWTTASVNGGASVVDDECRVVPALERANVAVENLRRLRTKEDEKHSY